MKWVVETADPFPPDRSGRPAPVDAQAWQFVLESAEIGAWDVDLVADTCVYSDSWKRMLGFEPHELADDPDLWLRFIHPDDRERTIEAGARHVRGETDRIETEFRIRHRNGEWLWVLDRGRAVEWDAAGRPTRLVGVQTDITGQKRVARELALLNARNQLALDVSDLGLWSYEIDADRLFWDRRTREIYGVDPDGEVCGASWEARLHPDDAAEAIATPRATIATGAPMTLRHRILTPAGETRHVRSMARLVRIEGMPLQLVGTIWDVTDQVRADLALAAEKERLRTTLHSIGDAVIATDVENRVLFLNPAAERLLLVDEGSAIGRDLGGLCRVVDESTNAVLSSAAADAIAERRTADRAGNAALVRGDGSRRSIRELASPVVDPNGALAGAVLVMQDVTDARLAQRELEHAARHDALTGLLSRAVFEKAVAAAAAASSPARRCALVFIDLDRFKVVNDTAGHAGGDALLRLVARSMRALLPADAALGRMGGDEFAALFNVRDAGEAAEIASRFVAGLRLERLSWEGRTFEVQASVGVAVIEAADTPAEVAFAQADAACFAAKNAGRNRFSVYVDGPGAAERNIREIRVASEISEALAQERFVLFGQEIRNLERSGAPSHIEVLCRMRARDGSMVPPGSFIPAAERFGLMGMLDRWIIENTVRRIGAGGAAGGVIAALNLSAQSLGDPDLWPFIRDCCAANGVRPTRLAFEITETAAIGNFEAAEDFVRESRRAGCKVSLDDFGSGLSSFGYLKRFRIDHIKIDGAFIDGLVGDRFNRAVVASISGLAKELGVDIIAERIEDAECVEVLRSLGVRYGQGYLFGRPQPIETWLSGAPEAAPRRRA